jgi:hypothetical protein
LLLFVSLASFLSEVDATALQIYDETFDRAVYSFALAKGLNAIISVLQSSEVNLSFFVGATVGIGQILDPINDLVERFSMIMLISSVSLGVQHLLLLLAKSMFLKVVLAFSASIVMLGIWNKKLQGVFIVSMFVKIVLLLIILRFGAVVFIHSNHILYNEVYAVEYKTSSEYISNYKSNLELVQQDQKKLASSLSKLEEKSEIFSKKVIKIITIFVITTVLFPLMFVWFFIMLFRFIFTMKMDYDIILPLKYKGTE